MLDFLLDDLFEDNMHDFAKFFMSFLRLPGWIDLGTDFELEFSSSSNRPLFGELEIAYGDFYHGSSIRTELDLSWRPSKYFQLDSEAGMTLVDLPGEEFEVLTSSVGLRITPTTRFSFNSITQFDNQSKTIGINNRVRYILKPGCDLFLVLNKGLERRELKEHRRFRTFKNEAVAKLGWTFQFSDRLITHIKTNLSPMIRTGKTGRAFKSNRTGG